jgi:uncharacterized protein YggU (UPF0235/DUF167 family)
VSALEWVVVIELLVLGIAAIMWVVGTLIAKTDPDDPIYVFCRTFWNEFLYPPKVMGIDSARTVAREPNPRGGGGGAKKGYGSARAAQTDETSDDDAFYGRLRKGDDGKTLKCNLEVLVEPNSAADEVVGQDSGGLRIRVMGEAGESRANKSLIEMVATAIGVKPYQVTLTKGHYQTRKTVQLQGITPDEVQERLGALPEAE